MEDIKLSDSRQTLNMMATEKFKVSLFTQLRARYPLFFVTTNEERRFISFLEHFCRVHGYECFLWDCYKGLIELSSGKPAGAVDASITKPTVILDHIREEASQISSSKDKIENFKKKGKRGIIYVLLDFFRFIDPKTQRPNPDLERRLKSIFNIDGIVSTIITGPFYAVPNVLENLIPCIDFPYPNKEEIKTALWGAVDKVKSKINGIVEETKKSEEDLINSVSGLTLLEAQTAFAKSLVSCKGWNIPTILEEKKQIISKNGILDYWDKTTPVEHIGGLKHLIEWIKQRKHCFSVEAEKYGLTKPKGLLVIGSPGCGKSLTCKAIATLWGMPLLRFDFGKMFHSHIGASEENTRAAIKLAESVAPCVLGDTEIIINNEKNSIEKFFDNKSIDKNNKISIFKDNRGDEVQKIVYISRDVVENIKGLKDNRIENIKLKAITRTFKKEKLIRITTESGKTIVVTQDHLLMDSDKKMKKSKDFKENDRISIVYNNSIQGDMSEKKTL